METVICLNVTHW